MYINRIEEEMVGKAVIITGGNRGIGKGCAEAFCQYGANVIIAGRDEKAGISVQDELNANTKGNCRFFKCDVAKEENIKALIEFSYKEFGRIDCLINNAGYLPVRKPIDLYDYSELEDVMRVNMFSMFAACKYALPYLRLTKGCIINISSVLAHAGQEGSLLYVTTKGAILSFSKSLAVDEARNGVRINVVSPGAIDTELANKELYNTEYRLPKRGRIMSQWIERNGNIEEIGSVCLFLSSSWASFMTGSEVLVDGGFMLGNNDKIKSFDWSSLQNPGNTKV